MKLKSQLFFEHMLIIFQKISSVMQTNNSFKLCYMKTNTTQITEVILYQKRVYSLCLIDICGEELLIRNQNSDPKREELRRTVEKNCMVSEMGK